MSMFIQLHRQVGQSLLVEICWVCRAEVGPRPSPSVCLRLVLLIESAIFLKTSIADIRVCNSCCSEAGTSSLRREAPLIITKKMVVTKKDKIETTSQVRKRYLR